MTLRLEEKEGEYARMRSAIDFHSAGAREYQKKYHELLERHKQFYITTLNWGYRRGYAETNHARKD